MRFAKYVSLALIACCGSWIGMPAARAADESAALWKQIPEDAAIAAVFANPDKFDKAIIDFAKRIDPDTQSGGILKDLKEQMGFVGEWIDFAKPFAFAQASIASAGEPAVWVRIPDFEKKIKERKEATEAEGVWTISLEGGSTKIAKVQGDYVIIADTKDDLTAVTKTGRSLGDAMGAGAKVFEGRDVGLHINFEPIRPIALGQMAQLGQMAPMMAMMAGPSMGVNDPQTLTALFSGLFDAMKSFVEQVNTIDVAFSMDDKNADLTLATAYKDGPIREYLKKQQPASAPLLDQIEEQPFALAMGYHFPGDSSPFIDYLLDKTLAAMKPQAAPGAEPTPEDKAKAEAFDAALKNMRELYRKMEGMNLALRFTEEGMLQYGDIIGKDTAGILALQKEVAGGTSLSSMFNPGMKQSSLGSRKVGDVELHEFSMKFDPASQAGAMAGKMVAPDARVAFGIAGDRVRHATGSAKTVDQFFSNKVTKPLVQSAMASEALAALPAKRNAIFLVDIGGFMPLMALMGSPTSANLPPGPLVGASASFSGDVARFDVHVPLRAIERVIKATEPEQPM